MRSTITSDPHAADGPRLWWLVDGAVCSDRPRPPLSGEWVGIAARRDRLLLWTRSALQLVDGRTGASQDVFQAAPYGFEFAGWGDEDTVEVYHHQTTGHPTDRSGFRTLVDLKAMAATDVASRQGIAPPWGSRGAVSRHGELCSGPTGIVYRDFSGGPRFWWTRTGRGGRRRLPDAIGAFTHHWLVTIASDSYVVAALEERVAVFGVKGGASSGEARRPTGCKTSPRMTVSSWRR